MKIIKYITIKLHIAFLFFQCNLEVDHRMLPTKRSRSVYEAEQTQPRDNNQEEGNNILEKSKSKRRKLDNDGNYSQTNKSRNKQKKEASKQYFTAMLIQMLKLDDRYHDRRSRMNNQIEVVRTVAQLCSNAQKEGVLEKIKGKTLEYKEKIEANKERGIEGSDKISFGLLIYAITLQIIPLIDTFLRYDFDVNSKNSLTGATPLLYNIYVGNNLSPEITTYLLSKHANPNSCTSTGVSPLMAIAQRLIYLENKLSHQDIQACTDNFDAILTANPNLKLINKEADTVLSLLLGALNDIPKQGNDARIAGIKYCIKNIISPELVMQNISAGGKNYPLILWMLLRKPKSVHYIAKNYFHYIKFEFVVQDNAYEETFTILKWLEYLIKERDSQPLKKVLSIYNRPNNKISNNNRSRTIII